MFEISFLHCYYTLFDASIRNSAWGKLLENYADFSWIFQYFINIIMNHSKLGTGDMSVTDIHSGGTGTGD